MITKDIVYSTVTPAAEDIWDLYNALGWAEFLKLSAKELHLAMQQSWFAVYAYQGERLVGTGRVVSDGAINAYLCGLGVHQDHRNKGIGTEISRRLVEHCRTRNLHIQFFCEERLVPYYSAMGFKVFAVGMKA